MRRFEGSKRSNRSFILKLIIHQVKTKEITTVMAVFGYLILISIDFHDFISPFST